MKKKIEDTDYYKQQAKNEYAFREMLKTVKPDLYVLFDILQTTGINFFVIVKILRALNNVAIGTGYGDVTINIQNGKVLFVHSNESDRVGEELIVKKPNQGTIEILNE
jgi:hypothetical protein